MTDLGGRVAVVTGAAVGSGRAIAERLAAEGAAVLAADIDVHGGEQTVTRVEAVGGRARFVRADMRVPAAGMTREERAAAPEPLPLDTLTDAIVRLVRDDELAGARRRPGRRRAAAPARAGRGAMITPCAASTSPPPT